MSSQSESDEPRIARYKPYYFKPVPGRRYFWCACGRSNSQPFCDGSHKGTGFEPLKYEAPADVAEVLFCGCKHSADAPFCDGAHNNLKETYLEDDPLSESNRNIPLASFSPDGTVRLNGSCYVTRPGQLDKRRLDTLSWTTLVNAESGAQHQSQFYFEIDEAATPAISFGDCDVVLLATTGNGSIDISGKRFELGTESGIYVRPGEAFSITKTSTESILLFASVCPQAAAPMFEESMPQNFDDNYPLRVVAYDAVQRRQMGDRSFQLLVGKEIGSALVTQFIGNIPRSKAMPHRHLYEESLIILSGAGCIWTEDLRADVRAGDVIFFPAQQLHSLQCTDPDGMVVAGVIYPGGNPDINY